MNEQNQFDWVDFYKEFASKLLDYKDRRDEGDLYYDGYEYAYFGKG